VRDCSLIMTQAECSTDLSVRSAVAGLNVCPIRVVAATRDISALPVIPQRRTTLLLPARFD
jgi:hypothetical protein